MVCKINKIYSENPRNNEERVWKGLKEYVPNDSLERLSLLEMDFEDVVSLSNKMNVNDYIVARKQFVEDKDAEYFNKFINYLKKEYNLDIGKGNSEFGYKMPLPFKNENQRKLIIFRRRKED